MRSLLPPRLRGGWPRAARPGGAAQGKALHREGSHSKVGREKERQPMAYDLRNYRKKLNEALAEDIRK